VGIEKPDPVVEVPYHRNIEMMGIASIQSPYRPGIRFRVIRPEGGREHITLWKTKDIILHIAIATHNFAG